MMPAPVLLAKWYANDVTMTSKKFFYVIKKIMDDFCVFEINQNQILTIEKTVIRKQCYSGTL